MSKSTVTPAFHLERSGHPGTPLCIESPTAAVRNTPSGAESSEPPDPDSDAIMLIHNGDLRRALCLLMQRHGVAVYRYCRRVLKDETLADDVHQQVFIEAYRDLSCFAGRSTLRTWLMGIARHRVLDAVKSRRRRHSRDTAPGELPEMLDPRPSPLELLAEMELHVILVANVEQLAEPARSAVLLRFQQGLTFEQMAKVRGESPDALHVRVVRALRRLRADIESLIADRSHGALKKARACEQAI